MPDKISVTDSKYPVDLDKPFALFFGNIDDDYLNKYDQFFNGLATDIRAAQSLDDLKSLYQTDTEDK